MKNGGHRPPLQTAKLYDTGRRIELPPLLALGAGELGDPILVHAPENILSPVGRAAQSNIADEVDGIWPFCCVSSPGRALGMTVGNAGSERDSSLRSA
jgi:hypothetical protein